MTMTAELQSTRQKLKRRLVEDERRLECYRGLLERKAELDRLKDAAANKHAAATAPLQSELKGVEDAIVARVVERLDPDQELEKRRKSLIADIEECNVALQSELDDVDIRIGLVNREILAMTKDMPNPLVVKNNLYRAGDPDKVVRCEALQWTVDKLRYVVEEANRNAEKYREAVKEMEASASARRNARDKSFSLYSDREQEEILRQRLRQWETTSAVVSELRHNASSEATRLREEIIDE